MVHAVIFDFDLTLADSTAGVTACANHALVTLGFRPAAPDDVRRTIGLTLGESFRLLTGVSDQALAAAYARHFVEHADQVMEQHTRLFENSPATLLALRRRGIRTAIVSTKFRYRIDAILRRAGLGDLVDIVVGGEDVTHQKPHPEGLLRALDLLGVEPSNAVYVGDHAVDAQAARAASVPFVAVLTGHASGAAQWHVFAPRGIIAEVGGLMDVLESEIRGPAGARLAGFSSRSDT